MGSMSKQEPLKLGFLFGAGAERNFGLPDGGEFALSLFKQNYTPIKQELLKALRQILQHYPDKDSSYRQWLDYTNSHKNPIRSFSKQDFQIVLESSAEQKKQAIINFLNQIDPQAKEIYQELVPINSQYPTAEQVQRHSNPEIKAWYDTLKSLLRLNRQEQASNIQLNQYFETDKDLNGFLQSTTFAILLTALRLTPVKEELSELTDKQEQAYKYIPDKIYHSLKASCKVMLYMALIACGDDILKALNNCVFSSDNEQDQVLSEVSALFTMDNSDAAEQIFDFIQQEPITLKPEQDFSELHPLEQLNLIVNKLSRQLCTQAMDYQKLLDNYFRYVMTPRTDWAKFTKIVLFLRAAYEAIVNPQVSDQDLLKPSYYQDIIAKLNCEHPAFELVALGSSNYIDFYGRLVKLLVTPPPLSKSKQSYYMARFGSLVRLNGGVDEFYNPFKNSLVSATEVQQDNKFISNHQLVAPFFFTQSGIKPITAIEISCRYADLYRSYLQADAIIVIGFNFNSDDSHINTIFRDLVENQGKHLICTSVYQEIAIDHQVELLCDKLRIDKEDAKQRVHVIIVDRKDRTLIQGPHQGELWLEHIIKRLPLIIHT